MPRGAISSKWAVAPRKPRQKLFEGSLGPGRAGVKTGSPSGGPRSGPWALLPLSKGLRPCHEKGGLALALPNLRPGTQGAEAPRESVAGKGAMRRVAVGAALTLTAWLGLASGTEAQCLITPLGPLAVSVLPALIPIDLDPPSSFAAKAYDEKAHKTPVARRGEGPHRALPPRDYPEGARRAG